MHYPGTLKRLVRLRPVPLNGIVHERMLYMTDLLFFQYINRAVSGIGIHDKNIGRDPLQTFQATGKVFFLVISEQDNGQIKHSISWLTEWLYQIPAKLLQRKTFLHTPALCFAHLHPVCSAFPKSLLYCLVPYWAPI